MSEERRVCLVGGRYDGETDAVIVAGPAPPFLIAGLVDCRCGTPHVMTWPPEIGPEDGEGYALREDDPERGRVTYVHANSDFEGGFQELEMTADGFLRIPDPA